jgi:hypothetical protein
MAVELKVRVSYDFEFVAPEYMGAGYKDATVVVAAMDYESAMKEVDVANIHKKVLPKLGTSVPRDPRDLTYIKVKTSDGRSSVFAQEWLATDPVFATAATRYIEVKGVSASDLPKILEVLRQNGYVNTRIK